MARVFLRRSREERVLAGHPWIYRSEIDRVEGEAAADFHRPPSGRQPVAVITKTRHVSCGVGDGWTQVSVG